jgi:hypothetical protein
VRLFKKKLGWKQESRKACDLEWWMEIYQKGFFLSYYIMYGSEEKLEKKIKNGFKIII